MMMYVSTFMTALVLLAATPAQAGEIHVALAGGCPQHDGIGKECSARKSCGGETEPCCTVQAAARGAKSGDTILLHDGLFTDPPLSAGPRSYSAFIDKNGLTIRADEGDTPVLSGGGKAMGALRVTAGDVTVEGLTFRDYAGGDDGRRVGIVHTDGGTGYRIRDNVIEVPGSPGEFGTMALRFEFGCDDIVVEGNTIRGGQDGAVYFDGCRGKAGAIVRRNRISQDGSGTARGGGARGVIIKAWQGPGDLAIYDNQIDVSGSGSTSWLFFREYDGSSTTWAFNNICSGACAGTNGSIYTQDNSCNQTARNAFTDENVWVFNNTIESRGGNGVHWQFHFSKMRVRNNIFDGVTYGIRGYYSANEGGCGHEDRAWSSSTDLFSNNVVENSSGGIFDGEPNHKPHAEGNVGVAGTKHSRSAITRRDAEQRLLAPTGIATNDPLGQGAGLCSISLLGETIDCSLDFDGADRGTVWDVGARQSSLPCSAP